MDDVPRRRSKPCLRRWAACPGVYSTVNIVHHRSQSKDTVYIAACLLVNVTGSATYNITQYYGQHGNGKFLADILFENITVPDNAVAILAYVIVNNGHDSENTTTSKIQLLDLRMQAVQDNAQGGINFGLHVVFGNFFDFIINIIDAIYVLKDLKNGCDGPLGAGVHGFQGADICSGKVNLTGTDYNEGQNANKFDGIVCSITASQYDVGWFAGTNESLGNLTVVESENNSPLTIIGVSWLWWTAIVGVFLSILL